VDRKGRIPMECGLCFVCVQSPSCPDKQKVDSGPHVHRCSDMFLIWASHQSTLIAVCGNADAAGSDTLLEMAPAGSGRALIHCEAGGLIS
jgi:hypothetical protein